MNNAGAVTASSIAVEDFEEQGYQVLFFGDVSSGHGNIVLDI